MCIGHLTKIFTNANKRTILMVFKTTLISYYRCCFAKIESPLNKWPYKRLSNHNPFEFSSLIWRTIPAPYIFLYYLLYDIHVFNFPCYYVIKSSSLFLIFWNKDDELEELLLRRK